jgi:hypothetical protein
MIDKSSWPDRISYARRQYYKISPHGYPKGRRNIINPRSGASRPLQIGAIGKNRRTIPKKIKATPTLTSYTELKNSFSVYDQYRGTIVDASRLTPPSNPLRLSSPIAHLLYRGTDPNRVSPFEKLNSQLYEGGPFDVPLSERAAKSAAARTTSETNFIENVLRPEGTHTPYPESISRRSIIRGEEIRERIRTASNASNPYLYNDVSDSDFRSLLGASSERRKHYLAGSQEWLNKRLGIDFNQYNNRYGSVPQSTVELIAELEKAAKFPENKDAIRQLKRIRSRIGALRATGTNFILDKDINPRLIEAMGKQDPKRSRLINIANKRLRRVSPVFYNETNPIDFPERDLINSGLDDEYKNRLNFGNDLDRSSWRTETTHRKVFFDTEGKNKYGSAFRMEYGATARKGSSGIGKTREAVDIWFDLETVKHGSKNIIYEASYGVGRNGSLKTSFMRFEDVYWQMTGESLPTWTGPNDPERLRYLRKTKALFAGKNSKYARQEKTGRLSKGTARLFAAWDKGEGTSLSEYFAGMSSTINRATGGSLQLDGLKRARATGLLLSGQNINYDISALQEVLGKMIRTKDGQNLIGLTERTSIKQMLSGFSGAGILDLVEFARSPQFLRLYGRKASQDMNRTLESIADILEIPHDKNLLHTAERDTGLARESFYRITDDFTKVHGEYTGDITFAFQGANRGRNKALTNRRVERIVKTINDESDISAAVYMDDGVAKITGATLYSPTKSKTQKILEANRYGSSDQRAGYNPVRTSRWSFQSGVTGQSSLPGESMKSIASLLGSNEQLRHETWSLIGTKNYKSLRTIYNRALSMQRAGTAPDEIIKTLLGLINRGVPKQAISTSSNRTRSAIMESLLDIVALKPYGSNSVSSEVEAYGYGKYRMSGGNLDNIEDVSQNMTERILTDYNRISNTVRENLMKNRVLVKDHKIVDMLTDAVLTRSYMNALTSREISGIVAGNSAGERQNTLSSIQRNLYGIFGKQSLQIDSSEIESLPDNIRTQLSRASTNHDMAYELNRYIGELEKGGVYTPDEIAGFRTEVGKLINMGYTRETNKTKSGAKLMEKASDDILPFLIGTETYVPDLTMTEQQKILAAELMGVDTTAQTVDSDIGRIFSKVIAGRHGKISNEITSPESLLYELSGRLSELRSIDPNLERLVIAAKSDPSSLPYLIKSITDSKTMGLLSESLGISINQEELYENVLDRMMGGGQRSSANKIMLHDEGDLDLDPSEIKSTKGPTPMSGRSKDLYDRDPLIHLLQKESFQETQENLPQLNKLREEINTRISEAIPSFEQNRKSTYAKIQSIYQFDNEYSEARLGSNIVDALIREDGVSFKGINKEVAAMIKDLNSTEIAEGIIAGKYQIEQFKINIRKNSLSRLINRIYNPVKKSADTEGYAGFEEISRRYIREKGFWGNGIDALENELKIALGSRNGNISFDDWEHRVVGDTTLEIKRIEGTASNGVPIITRDEAGNVHVQVLTKNGEIIPAENISLKAPILNSIGITRNGVTVEEPFGREIPGATTLFSGEEDNWTGTTLRQSIRETSNMMGNATEASRQAQATAGANITDSATPTMNKVFDKTLKDQASDMAQGMYQKAKAMPGWMKVAVAGAAAFGALQMGRHFTPMDSPDNRPAMGGSPIGATSTPQELQYITTPPTMKMAMGNTGYNVNMTGMIPGSSSVTEIQDFFKSIAGNMNVNFSDNRNDLSPSDLDRILESAI